MAKIYDFLLQSIQTEFDTVQILKQSDRGSVTVARHKGTGERYIFRQFSGSGEVYRRLLNVNCPNLPRVLETGERQGQVAVLEEYIQGDTLEYLLQGALLSPKDAKSIMLDLCTALWVLHGLGVVHRDIKPDNVILRAGEAVLIDLNASRVFKAQQGSDTKVLGTVGFAAPEQYGLSQTDQRADIYALGVLLNVMLTGKHPSIQLARGKYGRIIQRCTQTNPKNRYKSALHLMEALS